MRTIDIDSLNSEGLKKLTGEELVYVYLFTGEIPKYYNLADLNYKALYTEFCDFSPIKIHPDEFTDLVKWVWDLIPDKTTQTPIIKVSPIEIEKPKLPVFSYFSKPITNVKVRSNINLMQVYEVIKNPKYYEEQTVNFRINKDPEYKRTHFDYACFSGTFSTRKTAGLTGLSGYLCIDIDHYAGDLKTLKDRLKNDVTIEPQLIFISPSGTGLKVVVPYDTVKFPTLLSFYELAELYFLRKYNITIDKSCKNVDRACFLCHDPEVFINQKFLKIC
jgi:hypothetical protein